MNRRAFLRSVAAGGLALSAGRAARAGSDARPQANILMIYADDLDFDEISVYDPARFPCRTGARQAGFAKKARRGGYYTDPRMLTPHIAKLAKDGAMLTRFYITSPICTPSRYSVLTGRLASRSPGFCRAHPPGGPASIQWNTPLAADETNIVKALKAQGYVTGMVGKWHSGRPRGARAATVAEDADPADPKVAAKIRAAYDRGVRHVRETAGFDIVERIYMGNKESLPVPKALKVHNLEWLTEGALAFLAKYRDRPFFFYMPLTTPHGQYGGAFLRSDPRYTPAGVLPAAPNVQPTRQSIVQRLARAGIDRRNAMATWIDDSVGAILRKLDELKIADRTVVIFTSDHQSRGKYTCYEGARVPCIVRWPGTIPPGSTVGGVCGNVDLAATFLDIAGSKPAGDLGRDGRSFLPLLRQTDPPAARRDALLLECSNIRAVVTDRWKYIAHRPPAAVRRRMEAEARDCARTGKKRRIGWDGKPNSHTWEKGIRYGADVDFPRYFDPDQLYDLAADPFEQNNLAADPKHAQTLAKMKALLKTKLQTLPHTFGEFKTK